MTMVSLFFYRDLINMEPKRKVETVPDTDEVFFVPEEEPTEAPHYENDPGWDNEDDYRE